MDVKLNKGDVGVPVLLHCTNFGDERKDIAWKSVYFYFIFRFFLVFFIKMVYIYAMLVDFVGVCFMIGRPRTNVVDTHGEESQQAGMPLSLLGYLY